MAVRGLLGVADSVCLQGINWGRIVVMYNVACRRAATLAVRVGPERVLPVLVPVSLAGLLQFKTLKVAFCAAKTHSARP